MPIDSESWYESNREPNTYFQGDILEKIPTVFMPPAGEGPWVLLRPNPPITLPEALLGNLPRSFRPYPEGVATDAWQYGNELVLSKGIKSKVIVLTQSCDIERRKWIQVAPLRDADTLSAGKQISLELNDIGYMFYLPASARLQKKCFADLSQITSIHRSYLQSSMLIERLTPRATRELQNHLSSFFARPFGYNIRDTVPETRVYVCANCFNIASRIERLGMYAGTPFQPCPSCSVDGLWQKE